MQKVFSLHKKIPWGKVTVVLLLALALAATIGNGILAYQVWKDSRVLDGSVQGYEIREGDLKRFDYGTKESKVFHYQAVAIARKETNSAERAIYFPEYFQLCCYEKISNDNELRTALEDAVILGYYSQLSPRALGELANKYDIEEFEEQLVEEVASAKDRRAGPQPKLNST